MSRRAGFALFDFLLVAFIVAVTTATVIPQCLESLERSRLARQDANRRLLAAEIQLYCVQHEGAYPSLQDGNLPQLLSPTKADGTVDVEQGHYGPYFHAALPLNPVTGSQTVTSSADGSERTGGGWLYDAGTGRVWPDQPTVE